MAVLKSPFKFLDSYTKDDREIFFGRDREIEELYQKVFDSKLLLVYGVSGTGKSSLIHCGLANKFNEADWLPLVIRRGGNIIENLAIGIKSASSTPQQGKFNTQAEFKKGVRSLYLDHYKPVFFIFDQFEELFIFGSKDERHEFVNIVKSLIESDLQCRLIFVMREEYMASITEFEKVIPSFLANRVRIEKMSHSNALEAIEKPCKIFNISLEEGFSESLLEKLSPGTSEIELTYLQVFLDKIYRSAANDQQLRDESQPLQFSTALLNKLGNVSDLLGTFLDDQISLMGDPDSALTVLKAFVSGKGTKRPASESETIENVRSLGKEISSESVTELILTFVKLRVLRDKDDHGRYELRHDAIAEKIFEKFSLAEKELIEIRQLIENAYQYYLKRKILLTTDDLSYIGNKDSALNLNAELKEFLQESRKYQVALKNTLKRLIGISAFALIILLTTIIYTIFQKTRISGAYRYSLESMSQFTNPLNRLCMAYNAWSSDSSENSKGALFEAFNAILKQPGSDFNTDSIRLSYAKVFTPISEHIEFASCSKDNRFIYGYSHDSVFIWNDKGTIISKFKAGESPFIYLTMNDNSEYLGAVTRDSIITVWDKNGKVSFTKKIRYNPININQIFRFSKNNTIIMLSKDHDAELLDIRGNSLQLFDRYKGSVNGVDISDDGKFIAVASADSTIPVWYLNSDKNVFEVYNTIGNNHDTIWSVDFAPNGRFILSASKDRSVSVTSINNDFVWGRQNLINDEDDNQISMYPTLAEFDRSGTAITVKSLNNWSNYKDPFIFGVYYRINVADVVVDQIKKFDNLCFSPDKQYFAYVYGNECMLGSRQIFQISYFSYLSNYRVLKLNGKNPFFSNDGRYVYTIRDNKIDSWFIDTETISRIAREYNKKWISILRQ